MAGRLSRLQVAVGRIPQLKDTHSQELSPEKHSDIIQALMHPILRHLIMPRTYLNQCYASFPARGNLSVALCLRRILKDCREYQGLPLAINKRGTMKKAPNSPCLHRDALRQLLLCRLLPVVICDQIVLSHCSGLVGGQPHLFQAPEHMNLHLVLSILPQPQLGWC